MSHPFPNPQDPYGSGPNMHKAQPNLYPNWDTPGPSAGGSYPGAHQNMHQPGMSQPGMPQPGMPQPGMSQPGMSEIPLVTVGDITCTQTHVITPSGTFPIAGAQFSVTDMSTTTESMSQTGLVLALVGFFFVCFLSLLFLLMKERKTVGYVQIAVYGHGITHVSNVPALSPATMMDISSRVNYARSLAAMA